MKKINVKTEKRDRRRKRIRAKISGTAEMPRLSVFKSNMHISAQLINDVKGITLVASHSRNLKGKGTLDKAFVLGKDIAEKAIGKKIKKAVFDRGGYAYTGSVKAIADGARSAGLQF